MPLGIANQSFQVTLQFVDKTFVLSGKSYLLMEVSYSSLISFSQTNGCVKLVIYPTRKPTLYLGFSYRSRPGCMPPGFSHNHRIARTHQVDGLEIDETFLVQKDQLGIAFDQQMCLNQGMKAGQLGGPFCLHMENTSLERVRKQQLPCCKCSHAQGVDCNLELLGLPSRLDEWFSFSQLQENLEGSLTVDWFFY